MTNDPFNALSPFSPLAPLFEQVSKIYIREEIKSIQPHPPDSSHPLAKWLQTIQSRKEKRVEIGGLWSAFNFEQAALDYAIQIKKHYGLLRILGKNEPVLLDGIFTDVFMYDRPLALRRFTVENMQKWFSQTNKTDEGVKREKGLDLVKKINRLFVVGQPGAGKTTFLKYVALQSVQGNLTKVPIFISLRELADSRLSILDFIDREFTICNFPDARVYIAYLLRSGKAIILLDGLDEVTKTQERELNLLTQLENFIRAYEASQFIITCRTASVDYQFTGFTYVEMANFSSQQVNFYVTKWFEHNTKKGETFLEELNKQENYGLRELAQSPILLTLLCLTFDETMHFPNRRVEIYKEALDTLLKRWDSARNIRRDNIYKNLSLGRKEQLLSQLAFYTFEKGLYFVEKWQLENQILAYLNKFPISEEALDIHEGEDVLKSIEAHHGIIVERARDIYAFAHLTFQEFYTARYIVDHATTALPILISHLVEPRWREVVLLTASQLAEANYFFELGRIALFETIIREGSLSELSKWLDTKVAMTTSIKKQEVSRLFYGELIYIFNLIHAIDRALKNDYPLPPRYLQIFASLVAINPLLESDLNQVNEPKSLAILGNVYTISRITDFHVPIDSLRFTLLSESYPDLALDLLFILSLLLARLGVCDKVFETLIEFCTRYEFSNLTERLVNSLDRGLPSSHTNYEFSTLEQRLRIIKNRDYSIFEVEDITLYSELQKMVYTERFLTMWELEDWELEKLNDYLYVTQILSQCLKLSIVTNRIEIEENLWKAHDQQSF